MAGSSPHSWPAYILGPNNIAKLNSPVERDHQVLRQTILGLLGILGSFQNSERSFYLLTSLLQQNKYV